MRSFFEGWYLIYTMPRHEKKIHAQLNEMKIDSFLPTRKTLRSWRDRKKLIDEPLFPSYVFIYLKDMENYYKGLDADGALYYVRTGKEIARIHDSVVNNIRLLIGQETDIEISGSRFQTGRKLIITKGALTGLHCELVKVDCKNMLLVRVDLLQRNLLISLSSDHFTATLN